jgi:hypothetical protein
VRRVHGRQDVEVTLLATRSLVAGLDRLAARVDRGGHRLRPELPLKRASLRRRYVLQGVSPLPSKLRAGAAAW